MLNSRRKMTKDLLERDQQKLPNTERKDWGEKMNAVCATFGIMSKGLTGYLESRKVGNEKRKGKKSEEIITKYISQCGIRKKLTDSRSSSAVKKITNNINHKNLCKGPLKTNKQKNLESRQKRKVYIIYKRYI